MIERCVEHAERRELDLAGLDLLAQVLRRAAHHQPADEHRQDHEQQHRVQAGPHPAEDHLAGRQAEHRHRAAQRRERVQRRVHRPVGGDRRGRAPEGGLDDPVALLLAFEVPAGRACDVLRVHPGGVLRNRAVLLGGEDDEDEDDVQRRHRREDRPPLPLRVDHAPVGVGEGGRDEDDREHLHEVRERRRVLERHRRVDVEEPATVGAQLLDRDLRGHRADREHLVGALERLRRHRVAEGLEHTLGEQEQGDDDRQRQQDVVQAPDHVLPEVPQAAARAVDDPADQRDQHRHPDRRGHEVLHRQPGHLAEVAQRRLAAVVLPVCVGHERRRGVEGHVPGAGVEALRVEGLDVLGAQDQVQREPEQAREDDQGAGVGLPVLPAVGVDPH